MKFIWWTLGFLFVLLLARFVWTKISEPEIIDTFTPPQEIKPVTPIIPFDGKG